MRSGNKLCICNKKVNNKNPSDDYVKSYVKRREKGNNQTKKNHLTKLLRSLVS